MELILAIVELKQRNTGYGCPRIAQLISTVYLSSMACQSENTGDQRNQNGPARFQYHIHSSKG